METLPGSEVKKVSWGKRILRFFLWLSASFVFIILLLVMLTWIFEDKVKGYVISEVNSRLNTTIFVAPENIDLTIIRSFPRVSVEFNDVKALDAINIPKRDTLFSAGKIGLAFSITDLFSGNYNISHISMEDAYLNLWIDAKGRDNFHFLKEDTTVTTQDTSKVRFALEDISFKNVQFKYTDKKNNNAYAFQLKRIGFSGKFSDTDYEFDTDADFVIQKIRSGKSSWFAGNSGTLSLKMDVKGAQGLYTVNTGLLTMENLKLRLAGNIAEAGRNYKLNLNVNGEDVDITSALSLLPESYRKDIHDFESSGEFYANARISGLLGDTISPDVEADFGIRKGATVTRKSSNITLRGVTLTGSFSNVKGKEQLSLSEFNAGSGKSNFSGSFSMKGFEKPSYTSSVKGKLDLQELYQILKPDTVEYMNGTADVALNISGKPQGKDITAADFKSFETSGNLKLSGAQVKLKGSKMSADSINGQLLFDGNNVTIPSFRGFYGKSDFNLSGEVLNLLGYVFTEDAHLVINADFNSSKMNLNEILASSGSASQKVSADTIYRLQFPERVRLNLNTSVKDVVFRRFEATAINGTISLNNKKLVADPISMRTMDGTMSGSAMIDGSRGDSLLITCNADISEVNINKLFYEMENFGQTPGDEAIADKHVKGKLTSQVNFASIWGNDLNLNTNKLYTSATVTIDQGELIDFKPLYSLSKYIRLEDLRDIKFKTLHNQIEIRNRMITIPKMDILSSAININMQGTHDFDNMVDYHFIIDLDEIKAKKAKGAKKENIEFGVEENDGGHRTRLYLSMVGPVDNPVIKYDTKGAVQQMKEDVKAEKQNLKKILNDEFGWFKNDSTINKNAPVKEDRKDRKKNDQEGKFIIKDEDETPKGNKKEKDLEGEDF
ncbi:MAG: hypothetical protein Fur0041_09910 [Bacteroidia bacterium]